METIVRLCFELLGTDIPPKEISERIGIAPDVELLRGERNKARDLPRQNIWALESHCKSEEVDDHWRELEDLLQRSRDPIKEVAKTGIAKLVIVIDSQHRLPAIIISSSMAEFAGFVNALIEIDHLQT